MSERRQDNLISFGVTCAIIIALATPVYRVMIFWDNTIITSLDEAIYTIIWPLIPCVFAVIGLTFLLRKIFTEKRKTGIWNIVFAAIISGALISQTLILWLPIAQGIGDGVGYYRANHEAQEEGRRQAEELKRSNRPVVLAQALVDRSVDNDVNGVRALIDPASLVSSPEKYAEARIRSEWLTLFTSADKGVGTEMSGDNPQLGRAFFNLKRFDVRTESGNTVTIDSGNCEFYIDYVDRDGALKILDLQPCPAVN